ncbi:ketopantoate reductase family protein [Candidatus Poriferisodalis sp.]|uniref:ketopantoate reductase family protein n=1 Tax=Candidatus Poriferisodalis sp. TaxID=3101277 RepID=UPI003B018EF1
MAQNPSPVSDVTSPNDAPLNYVIHGAGAIGCVLGARLTNAGRRVALVARGDHLAALQQHGLRIGGRTEGNFPLPAVRTAHELDLDANTVVLLTMKTQHTFEAIEQHRELYDGVPLFCFQNSVSNEEWLIGQGFRAYGVMVRIGARIDEPGVVTHTGARRADIGCWPAGTDDLCTRVVDDLVAAEMRASLVERVIDHKWGKLVVNLTNAFSALVDLPVQEWFCAEENRFLMADIQQEAADVLEAAGITPVMDDGSDLHTWIARMRRPGQREPREVADPSLYSYPSTWQDLHFRRPTVEVEHFNGRICELGERYGIPTPLNRVLTERCCDAAARRLGPGTETAASLRAAAGL